MTTKKTDKPAEERFVTFIPAVSFTGFPEDKKTKFTAGVESVPIPSGYLETLREKGLVDEGSAAPEKGSVNDKTGETGEPEGQS
jgi:hypothetical protein